MTDKKGLTEWAKEGRLAGEGAKEGRFFFSFGELWRVGRAGRLNRAGLWVCEGEQKDRVRETSLVGALLG